MKTDQALNHNFDNAERIGYLIACFIKGILTPLERRELDTWIEESEENERLFDHLISEENIEATMQWYDSLNKEKARRRLKKRIPFKKERRTLPFTLVAVAASFILLLGFSIFFFLGKNRGAAPGVEKHTTAQTGDPLPGRDKAVLTLAGGKQVVLDSTAKEKLEGENIKVVDGTVFYTNAESYTPSQNVLTVPRGGQYKLVLSDGTRVWLNAESSLTYSSLFTGNERRVVLTGEGYFEVAKNKDKPFIVESSGNTIKVLGTHFNVNSYADEKAFTTTLLEGSVQLASGSMVRTLKPGQQARITENKLEVVEVNAGDASAWKDGEFVFRNTPVHAVASQLARWYDLELEFRDPVEKHLNATIKRDVPLSKVLHYLEETGDVRFTLEGRKLVVLNGSQ
jgi:transmembrane sensor